MGGGREKGGGGGGEVGGKGSGGKAKQQRPERRVALLKIETEGTGTYVDRSTQSHNYHLRIIIIVEERQ